MCIFDFRVNCSFNWTDRHTVKKKRLWNTCFYCGHSLSYREWILLYPSYLLVSEGGDELAVLAAVFVLSAEQRHG